MTLKNSDFRRVAATMTPSPMVVRAFQAECAAEYRAAARHRRRGPWTSLLTGAGAILAARLLGVGATL